MKLKWVPPDTAAWRSHVHPKFPFQPSQICCSDENPFVCRKAGKNQFLLGRGREAEPQGWAEPRGWVGARAGGSEPQKSQNFVTLLAFFPLYFFFIKEIEQLLWKRQKCKARLGLHGAGFGEVGKLNNFPLHPAFLIPKGIWKGEGIPCSGKYWTWGSSAEMPQTGQFLWNIPKPGWQILLPALPLIHWSLLIWEISRDIYKTRSKQRLRVFLCIYRAKGRTDNQTLAGAAEHRRCWMEMLKIKL